MSQKGGSCWNCGQVLTDLEYGRKDTCEKCHRDTRVCKNCIFHNPSYNNQCTENQADLVTDKDRSNFCDYFKPGTPDAAGGKSVDDLKNAADALFKK